MEKEMWMEEGMGRRQKVLMEGRLRRWGVGSEGVGMERSVVRRKREGIEGDWRGRKG